MAGEVFVTEVPGLHVTVVRGIHEISFERGIVRIWTYDEYRVGSAVERRVNSDMLMTREDLLEMYRQVTDFIHSLRTAEFETVHVEMIPEGVH